jgi:holo-[acyl-carrier protein] synthase
MEIVGVGTEIVECARIGRLLQERGEQFLDRAFTQREVAFCRARRQVTEHFAERWAAKVAVLKCLSAPWRRGLSGLDVEVHTEVDGQVRIQLHGAARERASRLRVTQVWLSLAHSRAYATAYALAVRVVS